MSNLNGLGYVNLELTSLCNKNCWMCGRRKIDRDYPEISMNYGHMDFDLLKKISVQVPENIIVQFHNNGEPFLYPRLGDALKLFNKQIRCLDTNGKLIVEKADEVIGVLDSMTISVIQDDHDADEQYKLVKEFLRIKKDKKPFLVYRCLGNVNRERWKKLDGVVVKRMLHNPLGSFSYEKETTIPEIGMCIEIMNHIAINRFGEVSICVRFDPKRVGVIGDLNKDSLENIWNGKQRLEWLKFHIEGKRKDIPLCSKCDYWGIPKG